MTRIFCFTEQVCDKNEEKIKLLGALSLSALSGYCILGVFGENQILWTKLLGKKSESNKFVFINDLVQHKTCDKD